MMNNELAYSVNSYYNDAEATLRTNSIDIAIGEFFEYVEDEVHANIIDNATGEVLAIVNSDTHDDYASPEMALMMTGFLAKKMWGIE